MKKNKLKKIKQIKYLGFLSLAGSFLTFVMFVNYLIKGIKWSKTYTEGTNAIYKTEVCNTNYVNALKEYSIELLSNSGRFHWDLTLLFLIGSIIIFILSISLLSLVNLKKQEFDVKQDSDNNFMH